MSVKLLCMLSKNKTGWIDSSVLLESIGPAGGSVEDWIKVHGQILTENNFVNFVKTKFLINEGLNLINGALRFAVAPYNSLITNQVITFRLGEYVNENLLGMYYYFGYDNKSGQVIICDSNYQKYVPTHNHSIVTKEYVDEHIRTISHSPIQFFTSPDSEIIHLDHGRKLVKFQMTIPPTLKKDWWPNVPDVIKNLNNLNNIESFWFNVFDNDTCYQSIDLYVRCSIYSHRLFLSASDSSSEYWINKRIRIGLIYS